MAGIQYFQRETDIHSWHWKCGWKFSFTAGIGSPFLSGSLTGSAAIPLERNTCPSMQRKKVMVNSVDSATGKFGRVRDALDTTAQAITIRQKIEGQTEHCSSFYFYPDIHIMLGTR